MSKRGGEDSTVEAIKELHITIALALGLPQAETGVLVGVDINRVSRIAKMLKKAKRLAGE